MEGDEACGLLAGFWSCCRFAVLMPPPSHMPAWLCFCAQPAEEWNAAKAQLSGTVHCDYPGW